MNRIFGAVGILVLAANIAGAQPQQGPPQNDATFNGHPVLLDRHGKLLPWGGPADQAYDRFLRLRWDFIRTQAPLSPGPEPRSSYPQYYFYCAYWLRNGSIQLEPFMNDIGEKIPNWFESARLYYAYTGDTAVMDIVKGLIDYAIEHGTSDPTFAWPNFPYTTTNAGDLTFRGFTSAGRFVMHEVQLDHAAEMGLTYYRMYLYSGEGKYLTAAMQTADALAAHVRTGTAEQSVWPYRVIMDTGKITSEYGANWIGAYQLLKALSEANHGNVDAYRAAMNKAREFILSHPMKTGYWTDGHSDTPINSHTYKSNLSASNTMLYLLDDPGFDPDWRSNVPKLIRWTEDNFVFRTSPGEPAVQWGAHLVGEQDEFNHKMDYQTARYAAACARWYAVSGDAAYREKAYRSLNWVTYCNTGEGAAIESPVSKDISNWWSDEYGECPRMFYPALAAVPEWAPRRQNHILYSAGVLRNVAYQPAGVDYLPSDAGGIEYLRVAFRPKSVRVGTRVLRKRNDTLDEGFVLRALGGGDYALTVRRRGPGGVTIR